MVYPIQVKNLKSAFDQSLISGSKNIFKLLKVLIFSASDSGQWPPCFLCSVYLWTRSTEMFSFFLRTDHAIKNKQEYPSFSVPNLTICASGRQQATVSGGTPGINNMLTCTGNKGSSSTYYRCCPLPSAVTDMAAWLWRGPPGLLLPYRK